MGCSGSRPVAANRGKNVDGIRVTTTTQSSSDHVLKSIIPADLNPGGHPRKVSLVWRRVRKFADTPGIRHWQWSSHWGLEVANHGTDGYIWELTLDPAGNMQASGKHWRAGQDYIGNQIPRKEIGFMTDLTDVEIQRRAAATASHMRRPNLRSHDDQRLYNMFQENCQQYSKGLAMLLAKGHGAQGNQKKQAKDQATVEAFFNKQQRLSHLGNGPYLQQNSDGGWQSADAWH